MAILRCLACELNDPSSNKFAQWLKVLEKTILIGLQVELPLVDT